MTFLPNMRSQLLGLGLLTLGSVLSCADRLYETRQSLLRTIASLETDVPTEEKLTADFKSQSEGYWCPVMGNQALFGCGLKENGCNCQYEPMFYCWHPTRAELEERATKKDEVSPEEWKASAVGLCFPTWWTIALTLVLPVLILCCCVAICCCMCGKR